MKDPTMAQKAGAAVGAAAKGVKKESSVVAGAPTSVAQEQKCRPKGSNQSSPPQQIRQKPSG